MNNTEIKKLYRILEANVIELTSSTRRRDDIAVESSAEELESILRANERELAIRTLENNSLKLRETRAALRRIQDGTYGICLECDEPISPKRLAAIPSATLCIRCQQAVDCQCGAKNAQSFVARPLFGMAA